MTSKVERINKMLEDAKAEEGRIATFKSFVRTKMEESQWVADAMAPFGLIVGDDVCMVSESGEMHTGTVAYTGLDDDDEFYIARVEYTDSDGESDEVNLGETGRTYFVTIL
jgi:hypothetical protein